MDPISPGIQTRPGVVTATGPTMRIWSLKCNTYHILLKSHKYNYNRLS
jgi:hypothetical protein